MPKKTYLLILVLLLSFKAYSQQYARFNHVALMVTNADKSADFYIKWFHLDTIKNPFPGRPIRWLSLGEGNALHLIQGTKAEATVLANNHLAFSVASLDDFIALLKKNNVPYGDGNGKQGTFATRSDGVRQVYFRDPDGYEVEANDAK
jgi:lactoylglutathione lyase